MKRVLFTIAMISVAMFMVVGIASASGGKLRCFADAPATCTLNSATSATIDTSVGGDAGVYLTNGKSTNGATLQSADFSFTFFCANTTDLTACSGGGAVRWSIPISTDGNSKTTEGYAFLDGAGCMNGGETPVGGAITVSTALAECPVNFAGDYANWDAFAAGNPSYRISGALPFVITDVQKASAAIVYNVNATKA